METHLNAVKATKRRLTSQTVQCQRVSTWCLHSLQVYTNRSWPWLCSSTSMHILLHLQRRRELNSQCLSLASVRKASRPSIRSQVSIGSGSMIGGRVLINGPACRWITKKTWILGHKRGACQHLPHFEWKKWYSGKKIKIIDNVSGPTSLCFSIVAYSFWDRSLATFGIPGFFLFARLMLLLFLLVFLLFFFLAFLLSAWTPCGKGRHVTNGYRLH